MSEKRLPVIADRVVWEKITKWRDGIRWDNVVKKIWKDLGGPRKVTACRKVWRVQDRTKKRTEERERLALRNQVKDDKH